MPVGLQIQISPSGMKQPNKLHNVGLRYICELLSDDLKISKQCKNVEWAFKLKAKVFTTVYE